MNYIHMGIDPGVSGAVTVIGKRTLITGATNFEGTDHIYESEPFVVAYPLKGETLLDQWDFIDSWADCRATLEVVHSMPKQGVASTFKFGKSYGNLEAFLVASRIPFERVTPSVWQKEFGLISRKGETKTAKKNRHKSLAQELFPSVKVTHAVADALLIAEYGRRNHHAM